MKISAATFALALGCRDDHGFALLANTDGLSSPFPLGSGQLERSDFARLVLDAFLGKAPPPLG